MLEFNGAVEFINALSAWSAGTADMFQNMLRKIAADLGVGESGLLEVGRPEEQIGR